MLRTLHARLATLPFLFASLLTGCSGQEKQWTSLLKEDFKADWETYIGPLFDSTTMKFDTAAIGVDKDPFKVFVVMIEDNTPVLRVSGENFGGISTKMEYKNYHFKMDFRWGNDKHHPKKNDKRDSGLLYHAGGKHGADFGFWMRSQEFQIQEGDCGDYWGVAGGSFNIPVVQDDSNRFVYQQSGKITLFNESSPHGRRCIKNPDAENESGEWNTVELYCFGDTAIHVVNDKVVMALYESSYLDGGEAIPLKSGKIQIQSEGAEVYYRNIAIRQITQLPRQLLQ